MTKLESILLAVALSLALIVGVLAGLLLGPRPAPAAVPAGSQAVNNRPQLINVATSRQITTTTDLAAFDWASLGHGVADIYYSVSMTGTDANKITLTLQVSPDASTWVNHAYSPTLAASLNTTTTGYIPDVPVNLEYFRLGVTAEAAGTVTTTIKVYLR